VVDQFILYDQVLVTWLNDELPQLTKGRTTQILIATARKAFAEVTTGRVVDNDTLTFPRISITRLDHIIDPLRFNCNRIRRLGWCNTTFHRKLRNAKFPTPVQIMYQVDFWTRFVSEMNLWEQKLLMEFAPGYMHLTIRPDDVWQNKLIPFFLEGGLNDNSDLDAGQGDRAIRRTATLRADGWLFDQNYASQYILKRIELQARDFDDESLYDLTFLPPKESIGTGAPPQVTFAATLNRPPVLEHTLVIQTVIGGTTEVTHEDGSGNLSSDRASGTVDYTTGAVNITYTSPPDVSEDISATYFTDQDA